MSFNACDWLFCISRSGSKANSISLSCNTCRNRRVDQVLGKLRQIPPVKEPPHTVLKGVACSVGLSSDTSLDVAPHLVLRSSIDTTMFYHHCSYKILTLDYKL